MYLTKEEEKILSGELGEALQLAMKSVVKVGDALGAEKLVKITNAHISGISYKNIGDAGLEFLEDLVNKGARVSVPTSINPAGFDLKSWYSMNVDRDFYAKQMKVINSLVKMGIKPTLTCTPYFYSKIGFGEHIAWSESNAVLYANSVIGARTNRDGGPLALFEALVGRAPYVGLHVDEGRLPQLIVDFSNVGRFIFKNGFYQVAGYITGKIAGNRVAIVDGLKINKAMVSELKLFLAAVGASGGTGLVLIPNVSPEYKEDNARGVEERVKVDKDDLEDVVNMFSAKEPEAVVIGCPHLSLGEIEDILRFVERYGGAKRRLLLFTARANEKILGRLKGVLSKNNVEVYYDTCMVVSDLRRYVSNSIVTDSAKAAYYLSSQGYSVKIMSRQSALKYAVGREHED